MHRSVRGEESCTRAHTHSERVTAYLNRKVIKMSMFSETHASSSFWSSSDPDQQLMANQPCTGGAAKLQQRWKELHLWHKIALITGIVVTVTLAVALPAGLAARARQCQGLNTRPPGMPIIFQDDFRRSLNTSNWRFDLGDGSTYGIPGWGNNELQCYTSSSDNVDVVANPEGPTNDGVLRIRSRFSQQGQKCINPGTVSSTRQWTSGKIDTKGKRLFRWSQPQLISLEQAGSSSSSSSNLQYDAEGQLLPGQCGSIIIEARMKLPFVKGRWAAFWMMPQPQPGRFPSPECSTVPGDGKAECGAFGIWPRSGEIDIMEHVNSDAKILGTLHYANAAGQHVMRGGRLILPQEMLEGNWNLYQVQWNCSAIVWYVNGQQMHQVLREEVQPQWPFDEPFFLILNTAVGGALTGYSEPDKAPAEMLVDYVRVYSAG